MTTDKHCRVNEFRSGTRPGATADRRPGLISRRLFVIEAAADPAQGKLLAEVQPQPVVLPSLCAFFLPSK